MADTPTDNAGVKVPPPAIYAAGFAAGAALTKAMSLPRGRRRPLLGGIAVGAGLALLGSSVMLFRQAGTHLEPWEESTALVRSGPYKFTRNPIYVGFTLVYSGAALWWRMTGALLTLPVIVAVIDRAVIAREERYLQRQFGAAYDEYTRSVRRWL